METQAAPLPEGAATSDESTARFLALRAWLLDWRNVAKITIKRREVLLRLGIGKRRSQKAAPAPADPSPPATAPAPVVPGPFVPAPVVTPAPVVAAPVLAARTVAGASNEESCRRAAPHEGDA